MAIMVSSATPNRTNGSHVNTYTTEQPLAWLHYEMVQTPTLSFSPCTQSNADVFPFPTESPSGQRTLMTIRSPSSAPATTKRVGHSLCWKTTCRTGTSFLPRSEVDQYSPVCRVFRCSSCSQHAWMACMMRKRMSTMRAFSARSGAARKGTVTLTLVCCEIRESERRCR